MSGMIRNEDVAYVRENVRIDDVVFNCIEKNAIGASTKVDSIVLVGGSIGINNIA